MTALQDKLATLTESLSPEEVAQIDAVSADAPPDEYPPAVRAKLQAIADQLSTSERTELLDVLAGDDVEGFMIKLPRVKEPGPVDVVDGGAGFNPGSAAQLQKLANFFVDATQYPTDRLGKLGS